MHDLDLTGFGRMYLLGGRPLEQTSKGLRRRTPRRQD